MYITRSLVIATVGIAILFSWFGAALGFVPLPPTCGICLCLILLSYAILTHLMKTWCSHRFGLS